MSAIFAALMLGVAWGLSAPAGSGFGKVKTPDFEILESEGLFNWMTDAGGDVRSVGLADFGKIRGVVATKDFKKDEIIAGCPSALALALSDPAQPQRDDPELALVEAGLNMLQWYKDAETWAPYISSLPTREYQFTPTPNFWDDDHIAALEFPPAVQQATTRKALIDKVATDNAVDRGDLEFATWLASSRSFNIKLVDEEDDDDAPFPPTGGGGAKTLRVCVPLLDMVNHGADPNVAMSVLDADKDDATFALKALRNVKADTQLTLGYTGGAATSLDLLNDYGFTLGSGPTSSDPRLLAKYDGKGMASSPLFTTPRKLTLQQLEDPDLHPDLRQALRFRLTLQTALEQRSSPARRPRKS